MQLAKLNEDGKKHKIKKGQDSALPALIMFKIANTNSLSVTTNTKCYMNKLPELQAIVYDHSLRIIGIAESWCKWWCW